MELTEEEKQVLDKMIKLLCDIQEEPKVTGEVLELATRIESDLWRLESLLKN